MFPSVDFSPLNQPDHCLDINCLWALFHPSHFCSLYLPVLTIYSFITFFVLTKTEIKRNWMPELIRNEGVIYSSRVKKKIYKGWNLVITLFDFKLVKLYTIFNNRVFLMENDFRVNYCSRILVLISFLHYLIYILWRLFLAWTFVVLIS